MANRESSWLKTGAHQGKLLSMESHNFLMCCLDVLKFCHSVLWQYYYVVWFYYVVRFCHYVTRFGGYLLCFRHDVLRSSFNVLCL